MHPKFYMKCFFFQFLVFNDIHNELASEMEKNKPLCNFFSNSYFINLHKKSKLNGFVFKINATYKTVRMFSFGGFIIG